MSLQSPARFVAPGDPFTEGMGDKDLRLPNDCHGWADRMAEELARHDPKTTYANLVLRSGWGQRKWRPAVSSTPPTLSDGVAADLSPPAHLS